MEERVLKDKDFLRQIVGGLNSFETSNTFYYTGSPTSHLHLHYNICGNNNFKFELQPDNDSPNNVHNHQILYHCNVERNSILYTITPVPFSQLILILKNSSPKTRSIESKKAVKSEIWLEDLQSITWQEINRSTFSNSIIHEQEINNIVLPIGGKFESAGVEYKQPRSVWVNTKYIKDNYIYWQINEDKINAHMKNYFEIGVEDITGVRTGFHFVGNFEESVKIFHQGIEVKSFFPPLSGHCDYIWKRLDYSIPPFCGDWDNIVEYKYKLKEEEVHHALVIFSGKASLCQAGITYTLITNLDYICNEAKMYAESIDKTNKNSNVIGLHQQLIDKQNWDLINKEQILKYNLEYRNSLALDFSLKDSHIRFRTEISNSSYSIEVPCYVYKNLVTKNLSGFAMWLRIHPREFNLEGKSLITCSYTPKFAFFDSIVSENMIKSNLVQLSKSLLRENIYYYNLDLSDLPMKRINNEIVMTKNVLLIMTWRSSSGYINQLLKVKENISVIILFTIDDVLDSNLFQQVKNFCTEINVIDVALIDPNVNQQQENIIMVENQNVINESRIILEDPFDRISITAISYSYKMELVQNWVHSRITPPWEIVQELPLTIGTKNLIRSLSSEISNSVESGVKFYILRKVFSGCGATATVRSVAFHFHSNLEMNVFHIQNGKLNLALYQLEVEINLIENFGVQPKKILITVDDIKLIDLELITARISALKKNKLRVFVVAVVKSEYSKSHSSSIISPFLEKEDIDSFADYLANYFPGAKDNIHKTKEFAMNSNNLYDRHVFTFCLAATKGYYSPVYEWVKEEVNKLRTSEVLGKAISLALISAFCAKLPNISLQFVFRHENSLLRSFSDIFKIYYGENDQEFISFIHPFIARLFLQILESKIFNFQTNSFEVEGLLEIWRNVACTLIESSIDTKHEIFTSILCSKHKGEDFSRLILVLLNNAKLCRGWEKLNRFNYDNVNKAISYAVITIPSINLNINYLGGYDKIVLARAARKIHFNCPEKDKKEKIYWLDLAIKHAKEAKKYFAEHNPKYCHLAKSLLGSIYGAKSKVTKEDKDKNLCFKVLFEAFKNSPTDYKKEIASIGMNMCPDKFNWPAVPPSLPSISPDVSDVNWWIPISEDDVLFFL